MNRPAIFLDRDGTININVHHLHCLADLQLIPGAAPAIARLNAAGHPVIVITNQSAIARGLLTEPGLAAIHAELQRQLMTHNATLNAIYHCPHHPEHGTPPTVCTCRKPAPGMLKQAAADHALDLSQAIIVGDSFTDLQAGWNAGCQAALVRTGYGSQTWTNAPPETRARIHTVGRDLSEVVDTILNRPPPRPSS